MFLTFGQLLNSSCS